MKRLIEEARQKSRNLKAEKEKADLEKKRMNNLADEVKKKKKKKEDKEK